VGESQDQTHPATYAPAGSSRGAYGSNEMREALGVKGPRPESGSASEQAVIRMNIKQVPKPCDADADPVLTWGRLPSDSTRAKQTLFESAGALMTACWQQETCSNTGSPRSQANQWSVRTGLGDRGWRRGPYYRRSRVTPVEGRGLGSRAMPEEAKARRLA